MFSNFKINLPVKLIGKSSKKENIIINSILIAVIIVSFLLRLLYFNQNPASLNQDEAMTGYNAYSLSRTLKDHWGYTLPAQMHGFGHIGIVSPLYSYLSAPVVGIMGLNETSSRLTAAIFNVAIIPILFLLVLKMFKNRRLALLAAILFSLNPWAFHYSRVAHEAVLAPFMYMTLILSFYLFVTEEKYKKYAILTGAVFGFSLYCYQNAWIISPAILCIFILFYIRHFIHRWRYSLVIIGITILIAIPLINFYFISPHPWMESRADQVSVFNKPHVVDNIIHNYTSHFTIDFMFLKGDGGNLPGMIGRHGMFLMPLVVLFPMGLIFLLYHLVARKDFRKEIIVILASLLLYPLVAAVTEPAPHALRAYTLIPVFHIVSAAGLWLILKTILDLRLTGVKNILIKSLSVCAIAVVILLYFSNFLKNYYFKYPKSPNNYNYYQYGVLESAQYVAEVEEKYDNIYFTNEANQPFIYVLFATQYDPAAYMTDETKQVLNSYFGRVDGFGKYQFISPAKMPLSRPDSLYITRDTDFLKEKKVINTIKNPDGRVVFKIWE